MANESAKRIAAANASILNFLRLSLLASNAVHLAYLFLYWQTVSRKAVVAYVLTEAVALVVWLQIRAAGSPTYRDGKLVKAGDDLTQPGLTQYLLDILYVTFATHLLSALVWRRFWALYALIPGFAVYKLVVELVLPRFQAAQAQAQEMLNGQQQPGLSKRQQKLQERYGTANGQRVKIQRR